MAGFSLDMEAANRFISSLSKSLQALCHGCMDFDSGIEIMGYININIDSGSKIDYVLNEKVMRSNTNAMTFVSNSYLSKKDQPKQTLDGSCSPIPELQQPIYPHATTAYSHHRPVPRPSHGSQGFRKRPWSGGETWKYSPQKQVHVAKKSYARVHNSYLPPSSTQSSSQFQGTSTHESRVPQIETPFSNNVTDSISIKKEQYDDNNGALDNSQNTESSSIVTTDNATVNVKSEPTTNLSNESATGSVSSDAHTDLRNTFLDNPPEDLKSTANDEQSAFGGTYFPSVDNVFDNSKASHTVSDQSQGSGFLGENPDESLQYDGATAYPGPSSFTEEGSRDESDFDIIEIGDEEDEYNQAAYGDTEKGQRGQKNLKDQEKDKINKRNLQPNVLRTITCVSCPQVFSLSSLGLEERRHHMMVIHGRNPFDCAQCGKGFLSRGGLTFHMRRHKGNSYACPICNKQFTQKTSVKTHLMMVHNR